MAALAPLPMSLPLIIRHFESRISLECVRQCHRTIFVNVVERDIKILKRCILLEGTRLCFGSVVANVVFIKKKRVQR